MRSALLSLGLTVATVATATYVLADPAAPNPDPIKIVPPRIVSQTFPVVTLNSEADLEQLRKTNPAHYAQATRIMAAANHLCRPDLPATVLVKFHVRNISCANMLLRTSNPPKRQINFQLDNTFYSALVTVTDDPPKLVQAH